MNRLPAAFLSLGVLLSTAGCAAVPGDFLRFNDTPGQPPAAGTMAYRLYVPAACVNQRCPLLVFLHGLGERGDAHNYDNNAQLNNNANGALQLIKPSHEAIQPMLMLAPQAPIGSWEINRLINVLDQAEGDYPFDRARIYLTGLSLGGGGVVSAMDGYGKLFAAAMPLCPTGYFDGPYAPLPIRYLPQWWFHANNDGTVTVNNSDRTFSALRALGGDPIFTRYDSGGHAIWTQSYALEELFQWMIAQRQGFPAQILNPNMKITVPTAAPVHYASTASLAIGGSLGPAAAAQSAPTWEVIGTASTGIASVSGSDWSVAAVPIAGVPVRAFASPLRARLTIRPPWAAARGAPIPWKFVTPGRTRHPSCRSSARH